MELPGRDHREPVVDHPAQVVGEPERLCRRVGALLAQDGTEPVVVRLDLVAGADPLLPLRREQLVESPGDRDDVHVLHPEVGGDHPRLLELFIFLLVFDRIEAQHAILLQLVAEAGKIEAAQEIFDVERADPDRHAKLPWNAVAYSIIRRPEKGQAAAPPPIPERL